MAATGGIAPKGADVRIRAVLIVALLLVACGDQEKRARHAREGACLGASVDKEQRLANDLKQQLSAARKSKQPTMSIELAQRRLTEDSCAESAACFGLAGEALSNYFSACLKDADD